MKKNIQLSNGYSMPLVGLGTYKSPPGQVEQAVKDAIDVGYRHFDCAWIYGNEAEIGVAIRSKLAEGLVKREDLFITSKLWNNFHAKNQVVPKLKESLSNLGLDYVDLYLIHWPSGLKETAPLVASEVCPEDYSDIDYLETWEGIEETVRLGLAKSIGLSNFNSEQVDRVLHFAKIKPVVNQVECNTNLTQKKLIKFCQDRAIAVTAYCPLGRADFDPKVLEIAKKYDKTPAQVVLNYLISLGVSAVPKSVTKSRIIENIDVFDFELDEEDVKSLDLCNKNYRICSFPKLKDHKYFPFGIEL